MWRHFRKDWHDDSNFITEDSINKKYMGNACSTFIYITFVHQKCNRLILNKLWSILFNVIFMREKNIVDLRFSLSDKQILIKTVLTLTFLLVGSPEKRRKVEHDCKYFITNRPREFVPRSCSFPCLQWVRTSKSAGYHLSMTYIGNLWLKTCFFHILAIGACNPYTLFI